MDNETRKHIMRFDEVDELRKHMLSKHVGTMPNAMLVRNADHVELDQFHIEAHQTDTGGPPVEGLRSLLSW